MSKKNDHPVETYNRPTDLFINKFYHYRERVITRMWICRFPMSKPITDVLNLISLGKFDAVRHTIGLDTLFHLYIYVLLDNGQAIVLTKNEIVKLIDHSAAVNKLTKHKQLQCIPINIDRTITVGDLLDHAMQTNPNFWLYDVRNNNCQDFVLNILQGNRLLTHGVFVFVKQDSATLFRQLPNYVSKLSNNVLHELAKLDIQIL